MVSMMDEPSPPDDAPQLQHDFWRMMTVQRIANVVQLADIIGDMSADGLELLRKMGDKDRKALRKFFLQAENDTFEFLADLRPEEVKGLKAYLILRSTGSYMAWGIGATLGGIIAVGALYNMLVGWFGKGH